MDEVPKIAPDWAFLVVLAGLIRVWMTSYLTDFRWRDLFAALLTIVVAVLLIWAQGMLHSTSDLTQVLWLAFLASSVVTFGHEVLLNSMGLLHRGPRADEVLEQRLGRDWRAYK